jgi:hypothetical protein
MDLDVSKKNDLLDKINNIECNLKNIRYCDLIIQKYKSITSNAMNLFDKTTKYDCPLDIDPLLIYKIINNNNLLINNEYFKTHIHDIYADMINKYICSDYYKRLEEDYISTEAKIYKIYIFRITAEKKLNTFNTVEKLNKELECLLKTYITLIT